MKLKILSISALSFFCATAFAQTDTLSVGPPQIHDVPIPVEAFASNNGVSFQLIVSKHFNSNSRFGFFNVSQFTGNYTTEDQNKNEMMTLALATFDVWKGFSLNAGAYIDNFTGFSPTAGVQYVFANREFLIIALPRIDLIRNYNFELFGLVEYRPMFNAKWGLYTRVQALYNENIKQEYHERSYVNLRLGTAYENYQFGIGYNYDVYGPFKTSQNSIGGFLRAELF
ncbi:MULTISPECIES: hypothetical protein [Flavobacterium]|uniref:hypothetical protein n=1 Tax=Flavobacterium TaxID=237 RepID=UPI001183466B|nr:MULTISPECIES: hypothetical protein [Flavobacterium]MCR4032096.1 hypothetical protein [Flavobacterium panacis]